jgi:hypothetical protein
MWGTDEIVGGVVIFLITTLLVFVVGGGFQALPPERRGERHKTLWAMSPALLPITIAIVGIAFEQDRSSPEAGEWGIILVWALVVMHVPLAVLLLLPRKLREFRPLALAASAGFAGLSLLAAFVSALAIGGDTL